MDKSEIGLKQEEVNHPFIKRIYRGMGISIAKKLVNTKITPNQVTAMSFILYLITAYLFFRANYISLIIAGVLLQLAYILDYADGSLARMKNPVYTPFGVWVDELVGTYAYVLIYIGATLGVYNQIQQPHILVFGLLASIGTLIKNLTQNFYLHTSKTGKETGQKIYKKFGFLMFFRPTGPFVNIILSLAAFLNQMYLVLIFLGIYSPLYTIMQNIYLSIKIRRE